jgi:predicted ATPase
MPYGNKNDMKITIKKAFRKFEEGEVFDFSNLSKLGWITIVGDNGSGKSSLIHALRGYKNDSRTKSLYERDFEALAKNIEVEHSYEKIFFLDNVKDNGNDFMVGYDAYQYIESGGMGTKNNSHGETSLIYLNNFLSKYKDKIVPKKTLIVFDEIDGGFSLSYLSKTINILHKLISLGCDILVISHNPFLMVESFACFDMETRKHVMSGEYIKSKTGFVLDKPTK